MTKIAYVCDICKKEFEHSRDLFKLNTSWRALEGTPPFDVCADCLRNGLLFDDQKEKFELTDIELETTLPGERLVK